MEVYYPANPATRRIGVFFRLSGPSPNLETSAPDADTEGFEAMMAAEAKASENEAIFHPHEVTESEVTAKELVWVDETRGPDADQAMLCDVMSSIKEGAAAEEKGCFHPHAPKPSDFQEKEPMWLDEKRGPGSEDEDERAVQKMVRDEAKAAENAGIFHPHAPEGAPASGPDVPCKQEVGLPVLEPARKAGAGHVKAAKCMTDTVPPAEAVLAEAVWKPATAGNQKSSSCSIL